MAASESIIGSTIRTHAVRMVVLGGLYAAMVGSVFAAYLAGAALIARVAFEAWGWIGALSMLGVFFLCTSLAAWLAARIVSRRMTVTASKSRHQFPKDQVDAASRLDAECDEVVSIPAHNARAGSAASIPEMLGQFLNRPRAPDSWVAPVAIGLATLAVVGPVRLFRVALRAVRIARTLQVIARATAVARQTP